MKKLMLFFAACICTISSAFAVTVVFVDDTGVYVEQTDLSCEEVYENAANSTYSGEVSCWDFNVSQGGSNVNGTAVPSVSIKEQMELSNEGEASEEATSVPLLMYNTKKGIQLVHIAKKSNRQDLFKAFSDGNCTNGVRMVWVKPSMLKQGKGSKRARNLNVNGKPINIATHIVTTSLYGDIIMGGIALDDFND